MRKKNVLFAALVLTAMLVSLFFVAQIQYCNYNYDGYETSCMSALGYIERVLEPLSFALFLPPILLLLSLLTYRMKEEVFLSWFNFAKWWVPVIIGVTLWIENAGGGGGWGMNGGAFDVFFIGIFYFIFLLSHWSKSYGRT